MSPQTSATIADRLAVAALLLVAASVAFGIVAMAVLFADVWELAFWRSYIFGGCAITALAAFLGFVAGPAAMTRYFGVAPSDVTPSSREILAIVCAFLAVGWAMLVYELH